MRRSSSLFSSQDNSYKKCNLLPARDQVQIGATNKLSCVCKFKASKATFFNEWFNWVISRGWLPHDLLIFYPKGKNEQVCRKQKDWPGEWKTIDMKFEDWRAQCILFWETSSLV